ncbi:hypothetical protein [Streptomyces sp. BA2]|nr:hypothetical protein [Streptomyces sp. BA2]
MTPAVEIVRAEGLGSVTMRRLARELDTGAGPGASTAGQGMRATAA